MKGSGRRTPARRKKAATAERFASQLPNRQTAKKTANVVSDARRPELETPRTFRLGAVPGATPGKWIDTWTKRMPHVRLELVPIEVKTQRKTLNELDAALVRLPLTDDALHVIPLYDESPVVIAAIDSVLMAAAELTAADLDGEVVIGLTDDVLGSLDLPGTKSARFDLLPTDEAIATAASGVGIVIVPMSLARVYHRKDVDFRRLMDGPVSTVALAWARNRATPDIETFVGIVRGRTANSSR